MRNIRKGKCEKNLFGQWSCKFKPIPPGSKDYGVSKGRIEDLTKVAGVEDHFDTQQCYDYTSKVGQRDPCPNFERDDDVSKCRNIDDPCIPKLRIDNPNSSTMQFACDKLSQLCVRTKGVDGPAY
jgi:hypothetical protein